MIFGITDLTLYNAIYSRGDCDCAYSWAELAVCDIDCRPLWSQGWLCWDCWGVLWRFYVDDVNSIRRGGGARTLSVVISID